MPLKITLKPRERLILGGAVLRNGTAASHLLVENEVPILRERDILSERQANSPCRRIYFAIQLMYVDQQHLDAHLRLYRMLIDDLLRVHDGRISMGSRRWAACRAGYGRPLSHSHAGAVS